MCFPTTRKSSEQDQFFGSPSHANCNYDDQGLPPCLKLATSVASEVLVVLGLKNMSQLVLYSRSSRFFALG